MTNEERQRMMEFILETQAQLSVNDQKHDQRLSRLERIVKLMVKAGLRARRQMREHDEYLREHDRRFAEMREFQAHSDKKLDALIDIVRADRNGRSS